MRIAQIATVDTPIRRDHSGSIEQLVWLLARELTALGHSVTTFGARGSEVAGRFIETLPGTYGEDQAPEDWRMCEVANIGRALEHAAEFDVIHAHSYLLSLPFDHLSATPIVHTLHIHPYDDSVRLRRLYPDACVTGISRFQWSETPNLAPAAIIPHGLDLEQFRFQSDPGDYVAFLGRFVPDKGALTAIHVARSLGLPLRLAGPRNEYFDSHVAPAVDGRSVQYVGPVAGEERSKFLGGARALLYPIEAPEPFGLVQVEAMICGTPVVAMELGAVPEIVDNGVTGFCARDVEHFTRLVPEVMALDRAKVRAVAVDRFSGSRMARDYADFYSKFTERRTRHACQ